MKDCAGTRDLLRALAHHLPVLAVQLLAGSDEIIQPALGLQFDFQLRDVEVLGIAQFAEQHRVHQLRDPLRHLASVALFGDLEEDDLAGKPGIDRIEQVSDALVRDLLLEHRGKPFAHDFGVLQGQTEVLGERAFPGAEEARDPHAELPLQVSGRFRYGLEKLGILVPNTVGGDVLGDLVMHGLLIRLIDLDDLFDLAFQVS